MFLKKLQNLPQRTRKIILWSVVVVLGLSLLVWWAESSQKRLENFQGKEFLEKFNFPKLEMPKLEMTKDELENKVKELEALIKNEEETSTTTE